ncbi:hypothetical protein KY290_011168 [Solanum tuberosum]|uniref:Secreted protein n=1 Tax=Solanum tuberosum TaxID=4113 RepID=A0ABQ7W128_SOLTU|nr:hypothetical protein KY290_011168 [Solanum tuberosum]
MAAGSRWSCCRWWLRGFLLLSGGFTGRNYCLRAAAAISPSCWSEIAVVDGVAVRQKQRWRRRGGERSKEKGSPVGAGWFSAGVAGLMQLLPSPSSPTAWR